MTKPKRNDPVIDTSKVLFTNNLKKSIFKSELISSNDFINICHIKPLDYR